MKEHMTISEISKTYGVHVNTVRNWLSVGAVAGKKDSAGRWLIRRAAVEKLLARRAAKADGGNAVSDVEKWRQLP